MGIKERNLQFFTLRVCLLLAFIVMIVVSNWVVKGQPARKICEALALVFAAGALISQILYRVKPDWFKDKTPYEEIPGRIHRQSDQSSQTDR
jgi:hypothetical protein